MRNLKPLVVICLASFVAAAFLLPSDPWAKSEPLRAIAILLVAIPAYYAGVRRNREAPDGEPSVRSGRRRFLQFSLRALLILMTFAALYLGFHCDRARRQKTAVEDLQNLKNCFADYDLDYIPSGGGGMGYVANPNPLAVRIAGIDFWYRVLTVHLDLREVERAIPHLKRMPYLENVYVTDYGPEAPADPNDADTSKAEQVARRRLESSMETLKQNLPSVHVQEEKPFVYSGPGLSQ